MGHHVGASVISLAPTFLQKSERAHSAAPPFQITTATLGCDLGLGANPEAAASILLRCSTLEQKSQRAHSAAPPFQITTATLGCDLGLDADLKAGIYIFRCSISKIPESPLFSRVFEDFHLPVICIPCF